MIAKEAAENPLLFRKMGFFLALPNRDDIVTQKLGYKETQMPHN